MVKLLEQYREIRDRTMSKNKYNEAKNDYFAFYIGRPLSYWLTIPFIKSSITPNAISYISIIFIIISFNIMFFATSKTSLLVAWLLLFIWNLLDGVDGNLARYKRIFSKDGSVVDAMSGYVSMSLTFLGVGCAASNYSEVFFLEQKTYIVLGAISSISLIFPRLVMHKYINSVENDTSSGYIKDKGNFSPLKILALNLTSVTGLPQVFILLSIILNCLDYLTLFYVIINIGVMFMSLYSLFKSKI